MVQRIGIDAGGTLIKLAYNESSSDAITYLKFPTARMEQAANWIMEHGSEAEICITGGKSTLLGSYLPRLYRTVPEFVASCSGASYLLREQGEEQESFILANAGTGSSIHYVNGERHSRIIGTGVGGGTLLGLAYLLTGISDYDTIVSMAMQGDREQMDLKVKHIYEGAEPPIPGDLTASNFGNVIQNLYNKTIPQEDALASIIGMVGETITTVSVLAAQQCATKKVVYIGSSFDGNPLLQEIVAHYTVIRECSPLFLNNGGYSGAIGALLSLYP